jgi:2Fe-2S ferredoxin
MLKNDPMPKVKLQPQNKEVEAARKCNLLEFLQSSGIQVGSACGGNGLCASCKVHVLKGKKNLNRPNDQEIELADRNNLQSDERIACQCEVLGDIEITTNYW